MRRLSLTPWKKDPPKPETEAETPHPDENPDSSSPDWDGIEPELNATDPDQAQPGEIGTEPGIDHDQVRRDIFYDALKVALKGANGMRSYNGLVPLKSLELDDYGDLSRGAVDQLHDRLMEIPWFAKVFGPIHLFGARYGAIFAFGIVMQASVRAELNQIAETEAAANDDEPKAQDEAA